MQVEISMGGPLAEALNVAIQPKLVEAGWSSGGADAAALSEYIVLMLVNGKSKEEIAAELSSDLLGLPSNDPDILSFANWLFVETGRMASQAEQSTQGELAVPETLPSDAAPDNRDGFIDTDTDMSNINDTQGFNAPTGPRSMRNGHVRGGPNKRMLGHINRSMDRSHDAILHRTHGSDRINSHGRGLPSGPRLQHQGPRQSRSLNGRTANLQNGLNNFATAMAAVPPPMNGMENWVMNSQPQPQPQPQTANFDIYALLEQQSRMMQEISQQMFFTGNFRGGRSGPGGGRGGGKSLSERIQDPNKHRNGSQGSGGRNTPLNSGIVVEDEEDVEMTSSRREPPNPDETVCKFNQNCTNKDCKYAHASPAAPAGVSVDIHDICTFGAACKNRKCTARHPSPAARLAHQSEQDCKFFPNCTNQRCPFKHPTMPACRNGGDCQTPGCKFTHLKTPCKFRPCMNRMCPFSHGEGQRGTFRDKVWVAEGGDDHISERKFVDDDSDEEIILPGRDTNQDDGMQEVVV